MAASNMSWKSAVRGGRMGGEGSQFVQLVRVMGNPMQVAVPWKNIDMGDIWNVWMTKYKVPQVIRLVQPCSGAWRPPFTALLVSMENYSCKDPQPPIVSQKENVEISWKFWGWSLANIGLPYIAVHSRHIIWLCNMFAFEKILLSKIHRSISYSIITILFRQLNWWF